MSLYPAATMAATTITTVSGSSTVTVSQDLGDGTSVDIAFTVPQSQESSTRTSAENFLTSLTSVSPVEDDRNMTSAEIAADTAAADSTDALSQVSTLSSVTPDVTDPGQGGAAKVYCNKAYAWSDGDGTFHYQHACGGSKSPWGYKISAALRDVASSSVTESGMAWIKNGTTMPKGAPHVEGAGYTFHGTFTPVHKGDDLNYHDTLAFKVNVGGATGSAKISIYGDLQQVGPKP